MSATIVPEKRRLLAPMTVLEKIEMDACLRPAKDVRGPVSVEATPTPRRVPMTATTAPSSWLR